jgi:hypothetical protein
MKAARLALIAGLIMSYLLPWHNIVSPDGGPYVLLGIKESPPEHVEYASGFRVCAELAAIAWRRAHAENPAWGEVFWTAGCLGVFLLPLLFALWALGRALLRRRAAPPRTWVAIALVMTGVASFLVSGNGPKGLREISISDILQHQGWTGPQHLSVEPMLWGPLACHVLAVALAILWVVERARILRFPQPDQPAAG